MLFKTFIFIILEWCNNLSNIAFASVLSLNISPHKVEITEILQKMIEIKAKNKEYALHKTMKMYKNEEVILDNNDFIDVDFKNV